MGLGKRLASNCGPAAGCCRCERLQYVLIAVARWSFSASQAKTKMPKHWAKAYRAAALSLLCIASNWQVCLSMAPLIASRPQFAGALKDVQEMKQSLQQVNFPTPRQLPCPPDRAAYKLIGP